MTRIHASAFPRVRIPASARQSPKISNILGKKKPLKESLKGLLFQLQQCSTFSPSVLPQLHAQIVKTHYSRHPFVLTRLAHAYLTSDALAPANQILANFPKKPPLFLWNEMIKGYLRNGFFKESIGLYYEMVAQGVQPNEFTFTFVLPACAGARACSDGRRVHEDVVKIGCESNHYVGTALVDMYGKCGEIRCARDVFDGMPEKATGIFNAMIAGYINPLLEQMLRGCHVRLLWLVSAVNFRKSTSLSAINERITSLGNCRCIRSPFPCGASKLRLQQRACSCSAISTVFCTMKSTVPLVGVDLFLIMVAKDPNPRMPFQD